MAAVLALSSAAAAQKPAFPPKVAGFDLIEQTSPPGHPEAATAGYVLTRDDDAVSVTVRVHPPYSHSLLPSLDRSRDTGDTASVAVQAAKSQTHRFYPASRLIEERPALLMNQGVMHQGRMATFEFDDLFAGRSQPIRMTVYAFCCSNAGEAYEYRFRHAAAFPAGPDVAAFMRMLAWR